MSLKRWWRARAAALDESVWQEVLPTLPLACCYPPPDALRLRGVAEGLLAAKKFVGARGFVLDAHMRHTIALQAAVPVLNLGLEWYADWSTVIVYPDAFETRHEHVDEAGVVHAVEQVQSGEAWLGGPVVLAWPDVLEYGVVIHEFAHKLDMLNGVANGMPPLHEGMSRRAWTRAFSRAYGDFCDRLDAGEPVAFDEYAGEAPDEFFAVASEVFFIEPEVLVEVYPRVYTQLVAFYRQDPQALLRGR